MIDARSALSLSLNIPNVWLLKEYGVARFAALLQSCGLATINKSPDRYGLSLILGGAEVTLKDVVGCYANMAAFAADFPLNDSVAIYSMLDAMRNVNRPDQLDWSRAESVRNVAWKTGTSYGARDGWAIGITPGYVVGVWVGNADGRGVADLTGAHSAGPVMFDIFDMLPDGGQWFARPAGKEVRVCALSGHRAGKYCRDTRLERIARNGVNSAPCPYCTEIPVSLDGTHRVVDATEPMVMTSFFQLPPVHKAYYKQNHADYLDAPPALGDTRASMSILYPSAGAVITLPRDPSGKRPELTCKAVHTDAAAELFWHLDNNYLGSTTDLHQMQIAPRPGVHTLMVCDNTGAKTSLDFIIR